MYLTIIKILDIKRLNNKFLINKKQLKGLIKIETGKAHNINGIGLHDITREEVINNLEKVLKGDLDEFWWEGASLGVVDLFSKKVRLKCFMILTIINMGKVMRIALLRR